MKPILVIADDLTGAAEIGGIAVSRGLTAQIHRGKSPDQYADVTIIDTDTRTLPPPAAAARVKSIVAPINRQHFDFIYKKTDSVLRGPVAAELTSIIPTLRFARSLLVPQNPSRGRVIVDGEYRIDGIPLHLTPVALDPEHPAATAKVRALLGPADWIEFGEGQTTADIARWAASLDSQTLPAGGADFFAAILESHKIPELPPTPFRLTAGSVLMICGSGVSGSREFVNAAAKWVCPMPDEVFNSGTNIPGWAKNVRDQLRLARRAIVAVPQPVRRDRAERVRQTLAILAGQVTSESHPDLLLIEGGATAAAIADRLGLSAFSVAGQVAPGVVALTTVPGNLLVIKPGSYPWPASILESFC